MLNTTTVCCYGNPQENTHTTRWSLHHW